MLGSKVQPHRGRRSAFALSLLFGLGACLLNRTAAGQVPVPVQTGGVAPPAGPSNATSELRPELKRLRKALSSLNDWSASRGGKLSAEVVDTESGEIWAEAHSTLALNPASNMKLVTAAVALSELGAEYRFSTGLYGRIKSNTVPSLVLRGDGDPSLNLSGLWRLAHALERLGVKEVGQILVDQSRFDDQFIPPAFEQQPDEWAQFRAPVSAVAINQNTVTFNVVPGAKGAPARLWFDPAGIVAVHGNITTRKRGSGQSIQLLLKTPSDNSSSTDELLSASVGGHVAVGMPRLRFVRRLDDPRRAPGLALRRLLRQQGIAVQGKVLLGGSNETHRLVFHRSQPLAQLIQQLGKRSDNFYAEMILKALGAARGKLPARSADGAAVVLDWLDQRGALTMDTKVLNGSGLFDANRLSARTLTQVLSTVARNTRLFPEFLAQLSIGGVDGTLRSRLRNLRGLRQVRAKTGTLNSVISLSGYLLSSSGQAPLAFSLLVNGLPGQAYNIRRRFDAVVTELARTEKLMRAKPLAASITAAARAPKAATPPEPPSR